MSPGWTSSIRLRGGVDLNWRPLDYEPKTISDFTNLQDAGALENPCKKRQGIVIGQLTGHPIPSAETQKGGLSLNIRFIKSLQEEGKALLWEEILGGVRFSERASKQYDPVYPTFWELLQPGL